MAAAKWPCGGKLTGCVTESLKGCVARTLSSVDRMTRNKLEIGCFTVYMAVRLRAEWLEG